MTRDSHEMNTRSLFVTDPQTQLRTALRTNDLTTFQKLVTNVTVDRDYVYPYPDYKTCLELAISEADQKNSKINFVKLLLQHGVEVNRINETYHVAPIHLAVEHGNIKALEALLGDDRIDVNVKSKGNTALLLAIKKIQKFHDDCEQDLIIYEDMIGMLLKAGSNVNAPDLKGVTPVFSAAKQGLERVVTLILDYARDPVDLDSYKHVSGKTARYYLKEAFPHLEAKFNSESEITDSIDANKLFSYLQSSNQSNFVRDYTKLVRKNEHGSVLTANNGMNTLLQLTTKMGLEKAVEILLQSGADPNYTFPGNTVRPVAIACRNGYNNILNLFIENGSTSFEPVNGESLLQIMLREMKLTSKDAKTDYAGCLNTLLSHPKVRPSIDVNYSDFKHNTALHYAARNGDQNAVLELLRKGACVALRNKFNVPPLADINAKTLEAYLDECVTANNERPCDDGYEIYLKYSFLVYPNTLYDDEVSESNRNQNDNPNKNSKTRSIISSETEALLYMTQNEELRPLLKHPVIASFIYCKWQRISGLIKANIIFYSLFWLSLIFYIICGYVIEKEGIDTPAVFNTITYTAATIGLIILIFRELFQLLVAPFSYLQSLQNLIELTLIFVTAWILFNDTSEEATKQQLSAVAILLCSVELVIFLGQILYLSTYIVMLRTVSWNFLKFIISYGILIIAFALSFYVLFKKNNIEGQRPPNSNNVGENDEENIFDGPVTSLFKTIVMLTGEFDAGSIKFSTLPVTSHIIFTVFVFMVPIVLFNLLNGLAVGDTQEIRANAELVGHISSVQLISYLENIFIGNQYSEPFKFWSYLPSYLQGRKFIRPEVFRIRRLQKKISLFTPFWPPYHIVVKPNQGNLIEIHKQIQPDQIHDDYEVMEGGNYCFDMCQSYRLDSEIIKNAKIVLSKKSQVSELNDIKSKLSKILQILESR